MEICKQQSELNRDMQVAKRAKGTKGEMQAAKRDCNRGKQQSESEMRHLPLQQRNATHPRTQYMVMSLVKIF